MNQNKQKYIKDAYKLNKEKNKSGALHQIKLKKMYEKEAIRERHIIDSAQIIDFVDSAGDLAEVNKHIPRRWQQYRRT